MNLRQTIIATCIKLGPLVLGGSVALALLSSALEGEGQAADTLGLGLGTVERFATQGDTALHCKDFTTSWSPKIGRCIAAAKSTKLDDIVLWLGNSQLHGLNQPEEGETTAIPHLYKALKAKGSGLLTLSQPNANFQEHYMLFEAVRQELPMQLLVLPAVFDDTREDGIRNELLGGLHNSDVQNAVSQTSWGQEAVAAYRATQRKEGETTQEVSDRSDMAALDETVQEHTERALNTWLEEQVDLWARRPSFRGRFYHTLYLARNTLLGISASTKRPAIRAHYQRNMEALQRTLQEAAIHDIPVLLYIAPIRSDVELPYYPDEYAQFKEDVEALAAEHGAHFINLETLVPGDLWGMTAPTRLGGSPEYDFMHFRAEGHRLLADTLFAEIENHRLLARGVGASPMYAE